MPTTLKTLFILVLSVFINHKVSSQADGAYDYHKLLHTPLNQLDESTIRKVMFDKINNIRRQHGLHELEYNTDLEEIATDFAKEKNNKDWWNEKYPHNNSKGRSPARRIYESPIGTKLEFVKIGNSVYGVEENLVTCNNTIYDQMESLMNSPGHKKAILSKHVNSIGIGYKKGNTTLVQLFANMKK